MLNLSKELKEMNALIEEYKAAQDNIATVVSEIDSLTRQYQSKKIGFSDYDGSLKVICSGKTKEEVLLSYRNYSLAMASRLLDLNSAIARKTSKVNITALKLGARGEKKAKGKMLPSLSDLEFPEIEIPKIEAVKASPEPIEEPLPVMEEVEPEPVKVEELIPQVDLTPPSKPVAPIAPAPKPVSGDMDMSGGMFSKKFWASLKDRSSGRKGIGKTSIMPSILDYEKSFHDDGAVSKADILDPYLLEKQIKELKSLITKRKPEVYKANTLGFLANMTVRTISIYFIERYPDFFRAVYKKIRYANLKILANTYINIVFFITLVCSILSFPVMTVIFAFQGGPAYLILLKILAGIIAATLGVFFLGIYYPSMIASSRNRSIKTNLPFAIDHMSSVIASGVTPATMFKLISSSSEYGEISVEFEKVTNYVDFFGYDIVTALKAVGLTTPSEDFKEFIDGFVSTIETGGDMKQYLSQKSAEALLNYRLERQKYLESLSTYSDIYTGLLIAAPLFFITTLALVAAFNGKIGGMSVTTLMVLGTYVVIPLMNFVFLVFLELNQPEI
jgi:pilus assembly protein TadC